MALHPRFFDAVRFLYGANVDFKKDVIVTTDGKGNTTVEWNLPGSPPTDAEIEAQIDKLDAFLANTAKDRELSNLPTAARKILFNHENRLRVLESKQPLTFAQFVTAYRQFADPT